MNQKQLEELEAEMYPPNRFDSDCEGPDCFFCKEPDVYGLVTHVYSGNMSTGKSYQAPMFEIKKDHGKGECRRCVADSYWDFQIDDSINNFSSYPYFDEEGMKQYRYIPQDRDFAAESSHP